MTVTKKMVIEALAELRVNRPRHAADRHIRHLLRTYGNGAAAIGQLDPELYEAVFAAAGGLVDAQDFYSVVLDVQPAPQARPVASAPPAPSRTRSPLTIDLESRLAARAGKPRSKPNYVVNVGSPGHFDDQADDQIRDFPAMEKMS